MNQLDQLKRFSVIGADCADAAQLAAYAPRDVTLDPSLLLHAVKQPAYAPLLQRAVAAHKRRPLDKTIDELLVGFGVECLRAVPGRLSTEIDVRLSFDTGATIARAQRVAELYARAGTDPERLRVKIAATWEGIQAAKALEHQGIHCHLTLVFSLRQAVACGEAGVSVVSPFVGRIAEWRGAESADADRGVEVASQIYRYFRKFGIQTEVMCASLHSAEQALALAGCDALTIRPALLAQLAASDAPLERKLDPAAAKASPIHALALNEASFRWALNEDAMATELLAEGIRNFAADTVRLERLVQEAN